MLPDVNTDVNPGDAATILEPWSSKHEEEASAKKGSIKN